MRESSCLATHFWCGRILDSFSAIDVLERVKILGVIESFCQFCVLVS